MNDSATTLKSLENRMKSEISEHSPTKYAYLFNGGTVVILIATSLAAAIPGIDNKYAWIAQFLSVLATFVVAAERALQFGARWQFQIEMKTGYQNVIEMIDLHGIIPEDEKEAYIKEIWKTVFALRLRESAIPGLGQAASEKAT